MDRGVNSLRDFYDWGNIGEGPVVDVGGADGAISLLLAKVSDDQGRHLSH